MKLEDLKGISALKILKEYKGKNPYIKKLKFNHENTRGGISLTPTQSAYIMKNHGYEPLLVNRVIAITEYLGTEMQKTYNLSFKPERILFEYILGETEKSVHVYGKLKKNQAKSEMYFIPKSQMLDDPYFEEIDIDVDFDKYTKLDTFVLKDGTVGRTPYKHQIDGVKFLLTRNGCILGDDMGLGKALSINELAFTPFGKVKMGDIKVGDFVIGSNGKKTKVLEVHPQPTKEMFRITFNDGYSTTCCKEHMWTVTSNNGSVNNKHRPIRYTNLTIEQMLNKDLEIEQRGTGWIEKRPYKFKTYYKQSNGQNKWQIPIVKPIHFENTDELIIDPYLLGVSLGVSLGDGHITKNGGIRIGLHKDDFDEIFNNQIINETKSRLTVRVNNINNLKEEITTLKLNGTLSHTKFIPDMYKYSSIEDRIAILQGLMDTDGHCMKSKNGNFTGTEYCSVSEQLADDVAEIVHSLGGIVRKKSKVGSYKKEDGTRVICKRAYRLNIKFSNDINPFRLKRKANEYNPPKKYKVGRYIKDITSIGVGESVCIKVDAEDSLFTLNHGIVTHNTYQAIIAALETGAERILIVCPSSVKINWEREIQYFQCHDTSIINGKNWKQARFTIINYDILKNFWVTDKERQENGSGDFVWENEHLVKGNFDLCIIDEAHYLKDHKSQRGSIMKDLCVKHNIPKVWLLTGTPVANRPKDYYNLLALIKAPIAKDWMFYVTRYCEAKSFFKKLKNGSNKKIWLTNGASNLEELATKTRNLFLRRLKTDIDDMPDKIITPIYHEMTKKQWSEYESLWEEYLVERKKKKKRGDVDRDLVELILLRQYIAKITIPKTIEMVENALEQDQKVIVFTNFTDELLELQEHFGKQSVIHYGEMSDTKKQVSVDLFQTNPDKKVFIGNIKSAGVGITLTEATIVIFNSFDWTPGNNDQAEDRSYRIGQTNHVNVYYQLFDDTIATKMWKMLENKKDVIAQIIGGSEETYDDEEIVELLMNELIEE